MLSDVKREWYLDWCLVKRSREVGFFLGINTYEFSLNYKKAKKFIGTVLYFIGPTYYNFIVLDSYTIYLRKL